MKMVVKTPAAVFSTASGSRMIVLTHFVCCTTHVSGPRYSQLIMETSDTESDLEVIPMKRCSGQRSKSLPFNTLRTSTTGSAPNVGNLLLQGAGHQPPTTLKVRKSKLFYSKDKMYVFFFKFRKDFSSQKLHTTKQFTRQKRWNTFQRRKEELDVVPNQLMK